MKDYEARLGEMSGMYVKELKSKLEGLREGWIFGAHARAALEDFIEGETVDIKSNTSQDITKEELYDLLMEAFDRIAALEKDVYNLNHGVRWSYL